MSEMRYEAPESLDAAVALLADAGDGARILAGGTDLLVQLRAEMIEPNLVVDIKNIAEIRTVTEEAGGFRVGAAVTNIAIPNSRPHGSRGRNLGNSRAPGPSMSTRHRSTRDVIASISCPR